MQLKHNIFLIVVLLASAFCSANAKSLTDFWNNRPKDFLCGLEKKTKFKTDTLTNDFMAISTTKVSNIQIKRLPTESKDSIMCVVYTYKGSAKESKVTLFTQDWKEIKTLSLPTISTFFEKPDTMSTDSFNNMMANIDIYLPSAILSPDDNILTVKAEFPLATKDEMDKIKGIYKDKILVWNGTLFK